MSKGWSINLSTTDPDHVFQTELPVPPLYVGKHGPVVELVFWSERLSRWVHGVSIHFERELPADHIQVTLGDMAWIDRMVSVYGAPGLEMAVQDLIETMDPVLEN